jgi:hypothetical protein
MKFKKGDFFIYKHIDTTQSYMTDGKIYEIQDISTGLPWTESYRIDEDSGKENWWNAGYVDRHYEPANFTKSPLWKLMNE